MATHTSPLAYLSAYLSAFSAQTTQPGSRATGSAPERTAAADSSTHLIILFHSRAWKNPNLPVFIVLLAWNICSSDVSKPGASAGLIGMINKKKKKKEKRKKKKEMLPVIGNQWLKEQSSKNRAGFSRRYRPVGETCSGAGILLAVG